LAGYVERDREGIKGIKGTGGEEKRETGGTEGGVGKGGRENCRGKCRSSRRHLPFLRAPNL